MANKKQRSATRQRLRRELKAPASFPRGQTLETLTGRKWEAPGFGSHLVTTIHRLHTKPIDQYSLEDLRISIGQGVGLRYLVPVALEFLDEDPLAAGDLYPGDLLGVVLRVRGEFWSFNPGLAESLVGIIAKLPSVPKTLEDPLKVFRARAPLK